MNQAKKGTEQSRQASSSTPTKVKDPVCGMEVDPKSAVNRHEHAGTTYYFCSSRCLERCRAEPSRYART